MGKERGLGRTLLLGGTVTVRKNALVSKTRSDRKIRKGASHPNGNLKEASAGKTRPMELGPEMAENATRLTEKAKPRGLSRSGTEGKTAE